MIFSRVVSLLMIAACCASAKSVKFEFSHPHRASYVIDASKVKSGKPWIEAVATGTTNQIELGDRVVIQVEKEEHLAATLRGKPLKKARQISPTVFILQAPDALTAIKESELISKMPHVSACYPVIRQAAELDAAFAPLPNDIFFYRFLSTGGTNGIFGQWNLENRTFEGVQAGADINVRSAWPHSRGEGVIVAVADTGIQFTHPELSLNTEGAPHFHFANGTTNAVPFATSGSWAHGTMVAGIIGAEANNGRGMAGIAHQSKIASWGIYRTNGVLVGEEQMMDMYQYRSNVVSVQNHSWGKAGTILRPMGILELTGLSNAIFSGRNGLGSVVVRSAGNERTTSRSPNDRGENANPWTITVGAANYYGRVTTYSEPGACVLVAAPSGESGLPTLFTSDLVGSAGQNFLSYSNSDLGDYAQSGTGFIGTSASSPQIAGIAALLLSINPALTYRDVQQVLIHSGKHWDLLDPNLKTNGAGLRVSHNLGYGIPDAGEAARLAQNWQNRPALSKITLLATNETIIPDAGLRVLITGENLPAALTNIPGEPTQRGPHPDSPTLAFPLVDVGTANSPIPQDLTGRGAVSPRDATTFNAKINFSAAAGAQFTIICNNSTNPVVMLAATDFVTIPAVAIPKIEGDLLRNYMTTNTATAHLELNSATYSFDVPTTLSCEHVGVRVKSNHPQRGDLRVTLTSPAGTRSILQTLNTDLQPFPGSWTYISTHHFYESSAGVWTVAITDEFKGAAGSVQEVELIVWGTPLTDTDHDGLEDNWELTQFGTLSTDPKNDADLDGYNNLREQILGTNPQQVNAPLLVEMSRFNSGYYRAGWPSSTHFDYEVWSGTNVAGLTLITNIPGQFPETDWVLPATNAAQFVRIVQKPK